MAHKNYGYLFAGVVAGVALTGAVLSMFIEVASDTHMLLSIVGGILGVASCNAILWYRDRRQKMRIHSVSANVLPERRNLTKQAVGKMCDRCGVSIVSVVDGHVCSVCESALCVACESEIPCSTCLGHYAIVERLPDRVG